MEAVVRQFRARGACVTAAWLVTAAARLPRTLTNAHERLEALWQRFLRLPLRDTSEAALPADALYAHRVMLKSCIVEVVAVDEIGYAHPRLLDALAGPVLPGGVQQSAQLDDENEDDEGDTAADDRARRLPRGTLKLTLTDGHGMLFGLEKVRTPALDLRMPPGSKIWLSEVEIRRGVIYLKPDTVRVLRCGRNAAQLAAMDGMPLDPNEQELLSMEELELRLQRQLDRISSSRT
ncbi:hypothetical protein SYNPS1DRAFT_21600 [Syncephalis pseudoplumigaleata]|uniref:RecQ-mediated genome instability protein 1 n=1 Tax=Syncephalis pseudoplumigaleata TaxID=1712513 RepID=A0A4P9Z3S5_9FUNG|nr:hypothetical protein SYNPS1DRAFT_21600 [Syncephalis pseudoplumigaleata]|eukprot:RKP26682.1 hypothetical protein SYNPS1DRAFT_21600 [Syncephalis pseudoplumigaleata]